MDEEGKQRSGIGPALSCGAWTTWPPEVLSNLLYGVIPTLLPPAESKN